MYRRFQPSLQFLLVLGFAFPDYLGVPAQSSQFSEYTHVACQIGLEFPDPVVFVTGRSEGARAALVLVPKTAMHKHGEPESTYRDIRPSGKISPMDSVAHALSGKDATESALGSRIPTPNAPHVFASSNWADIVHGALPCQNRSAFRESGSNQIVVSNPDRYPAGIRATMWKFYRTHESSPLATSCGGKGRISHWYSNSRRGKIICAMQHFETQDPTLAGASPA